MPKRKWYWDFEFFSKRNPTVAYWAGFLMADGGLSIAGKNSWNLALAIDSQDRQHIEQFCDDIGLSRDAIFIQDELYPRVHIAHMNLGEHFRPWGIVPRKTYNFVEPQVSDELLRHYLRGWADGDGHIYADGTGARFTVSGNPEALRWYGKALKRLGYSGNISFQERARTVHILYAGGRNQTREIIDLLVKDGDFKLERKWDKSYEPNTTLVWKKCEWCGKDFGVRLFRAKHPTHGRFCSRECFNESQKLPIVDGRKKCSRCQEMILLNDFSGNPCYCKKCWREYNTEQRRKKGIKPQQLREKKEIDGIEHTKCPKCKQFKPNEEIKGTYCRDCHREYTRERRKRKKK